MAEGLYGRYSFYCKVSLESYCGNNPSVRNQKIFDSSLYTREPWALPRQLDKLEFDKEVIHVTENCVWKKAQTVELKVSENILPEFSIGFDKRIPIEVEQELRSFVTWVENSYRIPITLWVDFEYNHYLISRSGKRVGYLFYWADFSSYPVFDNSEDVPQIRLPVRTEHSTIEEILTSFIEAITDYYAWLCNEIYEGYTPNEDDVEEILQAYLCSRK